VRILETTDFYPPIMGGAENHVQSISERLSERGHEVFIITTATGEPPSTRLVNGVTVSRISNIVDRLTPLYKNPNRRFPPPITNPLVVRDIMSVIKTFEPDAIHSHGWITYSTIKAKLKSGVPLVTTLHDYGLICPKRTFMVDGGLCQTGPSHYCVRCGKAQYGLMKSVLTYRGVVNGIRGLKHIDQFIAVSSFVKNVHLKYAPIKENQICVIPAPFPDKKNLLQEGIDTLPKLPEDFILFVGTLAPYKGVDVLIEAYKQVDTTAKLVLIGMTMPSHKYEPTDNILIVENALHEYVMKALSMCRFCVVPSLWPEPFGKVAVEAMSRRKAVIVARTGGLIDIVVDAETGILVTPGDAKSLANAMRFLLGNPLIAKKMGEVGYRRFTVHFSAQTVTNRIEKVLEKVCDEKRQSSPLL